MLYFDFDGTIADVWQRYYRVFKDASGIPGITLEEYIQVKRAFPRDTDVAAHFGGALPDSYWERKRSMLEDPAYLAFDRLIVPAEQICAFFQAHDCRILTNRRKAEAFYGEIRALGLESLLDQCIVLNPDEKKTKVQYLQEIHPDECFALVGDAEAEAQVAALEMAEITLVRTGLRIPESLPGVENCRIVEDIEVFMNAFKETISL